jgi:hypothetical protein
MVNKTGLQFVAADQPRCHLAASQAKTHQAATTRRQESAERR